MTKTIFRTANTFKISTPFFHIPLCGKIVESYFFVFGNIFNGDNLPFNQIKFGIGHTAMTDKIFWNIISAIKKLVVTYLYGFGRRIYFVYVYQLSLQVNYFVAFLESFIRKERKAFTTNINKFYSFWNFEVKDATMVFNEHNFRKSIRERIKKISSPKIKIWFHPDLPAGRRGLVGE